MTTRNFDALFAPKAVALIGASNQDGSVGAVLARNLFEGGFDGPIMPVNPHAATIRDVTAFASVEALPRTPDLAVIATPAPSVPDLIATLGARGCRAAIVISAGFGEGASAEGAGLRQRLLDAARPHLMRIVGPNCLGVLSPRIGLNASFAHLTPAPGKIAFVTQSGAVATSIIDWAQPRGIGFSHLLTLGDAADVDFGDLLDHLAMDRETRSILLYIESITQPRKFMSAARIAARAKPVILVKAGRGAMAAAAAASHSGALAGSDAVYDAAFRRAGMLRVATLRDLFNAAEMLDSGLRAHGDSLLILTNGGGLGVMATDALEQSGGQLVRLNEKTKARLDACLPATWSHGNPIDILGDAHGDRYGEALDAVLADDDRSAILVMNCPTGVSDNLEAARAVVARRTSSRRSMLACWMGEATTKAPRELLSHAGIPSFDTPDEAVAAFMQLSEFERNQRLLMETPAPLAERDENARTRVRAVIANIRQDQRAMLTAPEAAEVLSAYGVPMVVTRIAATPADARVISESINGPIALKILSRDISHKSDIGGVRLDLNRGAEVEEAAKAMLDSAARLAPRARIDGFMVQQMVRDDAEELIIGASDDGTFGPVILFGQGGVSVEVQRDRSIGLAPLNLVLARDMISRTRVSRLLAGYRDRPPADIAAVARALCAVSDLIVDFPEIAELDVNPLRANARGVVALDARILLRADASKRHFSVRPYPAELAHDETVDGEAFHIRPIRPQDEPLVLAMAEHTKPEHLRLRFHGSIGAFTHELAARLTQIDYDREMTFLALDADGAAAGVVRLDFDPNFETAEYAILVRSDKQGKGLGRVLMREALHYARGRNAHSVWGTLLAENENMLTMARAMGATLAPHTDTLASMRAVFTF